MKTHPKRKSAPLTVVVADDHEVYRDALCMLLELEDDLELVERTGEWDCLERAVDTMHPNIVLMDINMPTADGRRNGIDATKQLLRKHPDASIVILSMYDDKEYCNRALAAGAKGYFLKESDIANVVRAIRCLANGEYICGSNYCESLSHMTHLWSFSTYMQTPAS